MESKKFINEMRRLKLGVFTTNDAMKVLAGSRNYINLFLHRLAKRHSIEYISRGIYAIEGVDRLALANSLAPNGYISCLSALFYHGLIEQDPLIIDVINTRKSLSRSIEYEHSRINVRIIKISKEAFFGYKKEISSVDYFLIAEPEKAIIDMLYIYKDKLTSYCKDVLENSNGDINKEKLVEYAKRIGSYALLMRLKECIDSIGGYDA
ncbi:MAG: type IV toxin-antitoxin system AbiEi family antitoxin domain-containing protein [Candidatus Micrarchaeia archaeon]